jgi:replicative DNA helicase
MSRDLPARRRQPAFVAFFSLETSREQLPTRIVSEHASVPSTDIRRGNVGNQQLDRLASDNRRGTYATLNRRSQVFYFQLYC